MIDRIRQELWRDFTTSKADLKAVRRYVAKYRLPTSATRRLLQLLGAAGDLKKSA